MHPEQLRQVAELERQEAIATAESRRTRRAFQRRVRLHSRGQRPARRRRSGRSATGSRGGRPFARLWISVGASNLADGVLFAGLPVLAVRVTDSPGLVAGVTVALMLPMALMALPGGVVADRFDRRKVLIIGNLVRTVGLSAVLAAVLAAEMRLAAIYVVAIIAGGSETLVDTTAQSAVPRLVDQRELAGANAKLGGTQIVMNDAIGAPIGSFLAGVGAGLALGLPILLFAAAATVLRRFPQAPKPPGARTGPLLASLRKDLREGTHYLGDHAVLRRLAIVNGVSNLGNTAFLAVFVVFVTGPLGLPAATYGWFLAAVAAGGLSGSLVAGSILRALGHTTALRTAAGGAAVTYLVASPTSSGLVIAVCGGMLGVLSMLWNVCSRVLRQTLVPDRLLGRVTATMALVSLITTPVGALLGGVVAEVAGVRAVAGVAAAANLAALVLLAPVTAAALDAARAKSMAKTTATAAP